MMKKNNRWIVLVLTTVILITQAGCKSRKKRTRHSFHDYSKDTVLHFPTVLGGDPLPRQFWTHYQSRAEFTYSDEKQSMEGKLTLRMRRDSLIYFSVRISIGLEVAKGLINKDSAYLLDLVNNNYWAYSTAELTRQLGVEMGLHEIQNVILGNPLFDSSAYFSDSSSKGYFAERKPVTNVCFSSNLQSLDSAFVFQSGTERQLKIGYTDTLQTTTFTAPAKIIFDALSGNKFANIQYKVIMLGDAKLDNYPFKIPANATRKND